MLSDFGNNREAGTAVPAGGVLSKGKALLGPLGDLVLVSVWIVWWAGFALGLVSAAGRQSQTCHSD